MIEFANNAFKFFHVNVPSTVQLADESYNITEELRLSDIYFGLDELSEKFNSFLRGLLRQEQRSRLAGYSGEVVFDVYSPSSP